MQVQVVNTQSNQASFGAILQPKNINFNQAQEPVANAITQALRVPLQQFRGETAESFYKSKGLDFAIVPCSGESVSLYAYRGMKEIGVGVDRRYTCSDSLYIGEYDKHSEFMISDVETGIKNNRKSDIIYALTMIVLFAGMIAISLQAIFNKNKINENAKPLIENVDSVTNEVKSVKPIIEDSFKLGKTIIKK